MASVYIQLPLVTSTVSGTIAVTGPLTDAQLRATAVPVSQTITPQATTYAQSLTLDGTTAQTFTPPANAKNVKIHAGADNTINLMVAFGGTVATATIGEEFEAGRSEDYVGVSTISVICKSAITNHKVSLVWSV